MADVCRRLVLTFARELSWHCSRRSFARSARGSNWRSGRCRGSVSQPPADCKWYPWHSRLRTFCTLLNHMEFSRTFWKKTKKNFTKQLSRKLTFTKLTTERNKKTKITQSIGIYWQCVCMCVCWQRGTIRAGGFLVTDPAAVMARIRHGVVSRQMCFAAARRDYRGERLKARLALVFLSLSLSCLYYVYIRIYIQHRMQRRARVYIVAWKAESEVGESEGSSRESERTVYMMQEWNVSA